MSIVRLNTENLLRFSLILLARSGTFGELEENVHIDNSRFGPLEPPDSPRNFATAPPQVTNFTDILAVCNAIKSVQKTWEKEMNYLPGMQALLTTITASSYGGKKFKFTSILSSVLYSELISDSTNTSQPSTNELLANVTATNSSKIVNCINVVPLNQTDISVEIVNSTRLGYVLKSDPEVNNRHIAGLCSLVFFYARSCQFSILAATHFNVLPRLFPQVKMVAFNAISEQRYSIMYGITGVPSLILFHNGKPIAKYNGSDYSLYEFTKFVIQHTDLSPNEKVEIYEADFVKPVPGYGTHDYNYPLWSAWLVIIFWTVVYVRKMNFWTKFVEDIQNIWREAEAQHEHAN